MGNKVQIHSNIDIFLYRLGYSSATVTGVLGIHIVCFPLVVILWHLPRFVWRQKSWVLAFSIVNAATVFFVSFRKIFVVTAIFIAAAILSAVYVNPIIQYTALLGYFLVLLAAYYSAFRTAWKPSAVFSLYTKVPPAVRRSEIMKIDEFVVKGPVDQLTQSQIERRVNLLQNSVLYNRICLFIAKKLGDYQKSDWNVVSYILNLVVLLCFTVILFALACRAVYIADPSSFSFTYGNNTWFGFLFYSAHCMFFSDDGMVPTSTLSQMLQMAQFL